MVLKGKGLFEFIVSEVCVALIPVLWVCGGEGHHCKGYSQSDFGTSSWAESRGKREETFQNYLRDLDSRDLTYSNCTHPHLFLSLPSDVINLRKTLNTCTFQRQLRSKS